MKHMGKVHILKYILLLAVAVGVGVGGYEIGVTHNNNNSKISLESSSSVISKSSSSTTYNDGSDGNETDTTEDNNDNNNINSSSIEENQLSNTDKLLSNGTFAGYSNIHQLANAGYTVTSYLIEKVGMTPKQAHLYIKQHYNELQNFLTSGEIQTMYSLYGNN